MSTPASTGAEPDGPVAQAVGIGFRVLCLAVAVMAVAWAGSGWRQVPADSQAVILRFGGIAGVQQAGLALSWPRPTGQVALVPGADRLLTLQTAATTRTAGLEDVVTQADGAALPPGADSFLTGDGGVVLLGATIAYRVADGAAYYLAQPHVEPALRRVFAASAVAVAAARGLDDILVARPDHGGSDAAAAEARRQAIRSDLRREMNRRLAALDAVGAALGVQVARIDLQASLPPAAKAAFDGVLVAAQLAEQGIAAARTEAARTAAAADRERDRLLLAAQAGAAERIAEARARTAAVSAVEASMTPATRPAILDGLYRDQLATVLRRVGRVSAVDPHGGVRVMLPAAAPTGAGP